VSPRAVGVASTLCDVHGDVRERRLNSDSSISLLLQVRWITLTSAYEPNLPTDRIVLTGFATDPSPPSRLKSAQLNSYLHSSGRNREAFPRKAFSPTATAIPENRVAQEAPPTVWKYLPSTTGRISIGKNEDRDEGFRNPQSLAQDS
jgi:hypothetical protein